VRRLTRSADNRNLGTAPSGKRNISGIPRTGASAVMVIVFATPVPVEAVDALPARLLSGPAWAGGGITRLQGLTGFLLTASANRPPGFLARYLWEIVGVVVLLILAVLLAFLRRRARLAADVRGLSAVIRRNGEPVGPDLRAPSKQNQTFRFVIRDEGELTERLDYARPDDSVYVARRGKIGQVRVETPTGELYDITVGSSGEPLPSGLWLAFRDARYPGSRARPSQSEESMVARGLMPPTPSADPGQGTAASPSPPDDPWLT